MDLLKIGLLSSFVAAIFTCVECYCYSQTYYARTYSQQTSVYSSPYDYCTIYISPAYFGSSSYYLEISWSSYHFDVKGNMPHCNEDYVEVFLTRSYKSIGRFCSNNAGKPFKMYSSDGYAKIVHSTNGYATGRGFTLNYSLKSRTTEYLGGSPTDTSCYNANNYYENFGVIYSTGWPYGYGQSSSYCDFSISMNYFSRGVYVVFMDINMYKYGSSMDYVQLFGSNFSSYTMTALSSKLYGTLSNKKYVSYDTYLKIRFDRTHGAGYSSSYRGFVAGYIMFTPPTAIKDNTIVHTSPKSSSVLVGAIVGTVVPAFIIVLVIIIALIYSKRRRRRRAAANALCSTQNTATALSPEQTTTHLTTQALHSMSHTNAAFSNQQNMFPAGTIQTGSLMTESHAMSYSTPYPTVQQSAVGSATFIVTPSNTSLPPGALMAPSVPGSQGQQSVGNMSCPSNTAANYSGTLPPMMSSQHTTGNAPPPYSKK